MSLKRSFPPIVDTETRLLILGSLPGEVSLARGQYYGHPQNRFWRLVGEVIGQELVAMDYASRLATLLKHHIGLWDVVAQAQREGSLDSNIRNHAHNDLVTLLDTLPRLATIAFNGATAEKLGLKALGARSANYRVLRLPSSSPAHASVTYAQKLEVWRQIGEP